MMIFLLILNLASAELTTASCQTWLDLLMQEYDSRNGTCYNATAGSRAQIALDAQGVIASCFFRMHCITRLVGITDDAIAMSPPPLINMSNYDPFWQTKVNSSYCSGARTINQLFQRLS
jgi:hypothetical protein